MENTTYSVISLQQLTKDYIPVFKQHFPDCTIGRKFAKYKNRILCFNDNYVFGTDYVGNINKFIISEYHKSLFKNLNYLYDDKNNIIEEY